MGLLTIVVQMHDHSSIPDLTRIKRKAKALKRNNGSMTYMQYLDQAAREIYGVRHFHEAQAHYAQAHFAQEKSAQPATENVQQASPLQYYLRSVQEYYLDF